MEGWKYFFGLLWKPIDPGGITMHPPFTPISIQKNDHPPPFRLAKKRIHKDSNLKEELTNLFWRLLGIPYSHRQSANGNITKFW